MNYRNPFLLIPKNMSYRKGSLDKGLHLSKPYCPYMPNERCQDGGLIWGEVICGCRELFWDVPWMSSSLPAWQCGINPSSIFLGRKLGTRDSELWRQLRRKQSQEKESEEGSGTRDDCLSHQKMLLNKQQVSSINKACGMQMRFFFLLLFCWLSSPKTPLRILIRNAKINKSPANPFLLLNKGKVNIANWTYFIRGCFVWAKKKRERKEKAICFLAANTCLCWILVSNLMTGALFLVCLEFRPFDIWGERSQASRKARFGPCWAYSPLSPVSKQEFFSHPGNDDSELRGGDLQGIIYKIKATWDKEEF